ncbi:D-2-hydroxyacid dehydrogenase [Chitinimonas sp. BJYL2]|uniref:D-2-hydroxyacid dehydrogenase n=1 Tax=Chitinimonas sp. BJYL2 TaxID=2976696 RepID=UPI0022B55326|nr:D-2-hydroxyacid dehydrogenase [Chitinimonas sp. BJYL2]
MLRIVFLDRDSLPVPLRQPDLPHQWVNYSATTPAQLLDHCRGADVVVSNKVVLNADTLAALPDLKLIAVAATGVNNVDLAAAKAHGIAVCNIRGYAETTVPEHALMLMLALMRNLPAYQHDLAAGAWQQSPHFCHFGAPIRDLRGRTLLIVGAGSLGRGTARLAEAFGMQVLFAEHKGATSVRPGYVDFGAGLAAADIVSIHCPLNDRTRGLIGAAELAHMRQGTVLINTARGGIVDEAALLAALRSGHLGGAGFDVLLEEPPRQGNALLDVQLPNLIMTPHVGWASYEAMSALAEQLVGNIEAWAHGTPRHLVQPSP